MSIDPRTPVLVGQGQVVNRPKTLDDSREPVELIVEAISEAVSDAGLGRVPDVDELVIVRLLSWKYSNPAARVAEMLGIKAQIHGTTPHGGNMPQTLVNRVSLEIQKGNREIAIIAGGEASHSRSRAHRENSHLKWAIDKPNFQDPQMVIQEVALSSDAEIARQIVLPMQIYPLFESAIRAHEGRSPMEHEIFISELWERFNQVAQTNPFSWSTQPLTAAEIRNTSSNNRMIGLPYRKVMNSNNQVDMSAAIILCSVEKARSLGIPQDRWIFPLSGADCHEHYFVSNRNTFFETPAIRLGGQMALDLAATNIEEVSLVDLYSCFPSAVQLGCQSLGLDITQQLTITGGLSFAGGPWNNYSMHAIATMISKLRQIPNAKGLVWANGGYATKHSFGIYSSQPPSTGFKLGSPQDLVDAGPIRILATPEEAVGPAKVEAYTVMHDRHNSPERIIAATLLADGRRAWGTSTEQGLCQSMCRGEWVGHKVNLTQNGTLKI